MSETSIGTTWERLLEGREQSQTQVLKKGARMLQEAAQISPGSLLQWLARCHPSSWAHA